MRQRLSYLTTASDVWCWDLNPDRGTSICALNGRWFSHQITHRCHFLWGDFSLGWVYYFLLFFPCVLTTFCTHCHCGCYCNVIGDYFFLLIDGELLEKKHCFFCFSFFPLSTWHRVDPQWMLKGRMKLVYILSL